MQTRIPKTGRMSHFQLICTIPVLIPYRMPGNRVVNLSVDFQVLRHRAEYRAIPQCDPAARCLVDLPDVLAFAVDNGQPVLQRKDLQQVAQEILLQLQDRLKTSLLHNRRRRDN